ncbi:MAG: hypothetical protein IJZ85_06970 [Lachnospiraceae bacterium]|nr:hypothetical protein [Lachnospiraceae bacterium]
MIKVNGGDRAEKKSLPGWRHKVESKCVMAKVKCNPVMDKIWRQRNLILGALIGAVCFVYLYGTKILDPTYDDWLLVSHGDLTQHYQGWQFFRNSEWKFPLGLFNTLSYPIDTTIIYMDSIPLVAVFFKLLSPILPSAFQYFGWWGMLCFMLQGAFSAKILEKYLKSTPAVCMGVFFFTTAAIVLFRMYMHTSLASQWLILLGILFLVYYEEYFKHYKHALIGWGILGFLCGAIHPYFLALCGIVLLGFVCRDFIENRKFKRAVGLLASFIGCAAVAVYLMGGFSGSATAGGTGLGTYSFNLTGFFNPAGWSSLLPTLGTVGGGQIEGYAYLGAGVLAMLPVSLILFLWNNRKSLKDRQWWIGTLLRAIPWIVICGISFAVSLSPKITFNDKTLFTIPLPNIVESLWSIFRATGRLIWPVVYILMIFAVCAGCYKSPYWLKQAVLLVFVLLQLYDLRPVLYSRHDSYRQEVVYTPSITGPVWEEIGESGKIKHLMVRDIYTTGMEYFYQLAEYAHRYGIDQNYYHYGHSIGTEPAQLVVEGLENPRDDTMYVFNSKFWLRCGQYDMHYYQAGYFIVGLTWQLENVEEIDPATLSSVVWEFGDNKYLSSGEDIEGIRHIHPGGFSFGPYYYLPEGRYLVTVEGTGLETANLSCTHDNGTGKLDTQQLEIDEAGAIFYIEVPGDLDGFELVIRNNGTEDICLDKITIQVVRE